MPFVYVTDPREADGPRVSCSYKATRMVRPFFFLFFPL